MPGEKIPFQHALSPASKGFLSALLPIFLAPPSNGADRAGVAWGSGVVWPGISSHKPTLGCLSSWVTERQKSISWGGVELGETARCQPSIHSSLPTKP